MYKTKLSLLDKPHMLKPKSIDRRNWSNWTKKDWSLKKNWKIYCKTWKTL